MGSSSEDEDGASRRRGAWGAEADAYYAGGRSDSDLDRDAGDLGADSESEAEVAAEVEAQFERRARVHADLDHAEEIAQLLGSVRAQLAAPAGSAVETVVSEQVSDKRAQIAPVLGEIRKRSRELIRAVERLEEAAAAPPGAGGADAAAPGAVDPGFSFFEMRIQLLHAYLVYLTFYILLKISGDSAENHPVAERLLEVKLLLNKAKPLEQRLQPRVRALLAPLDRSPRAALPAPPPVSPAKEEARGGRRGRGAGAEGKSAARAAAAAAGGGGYDSDAGSVTSDGGASDGGSEGSMDGSDGSHCGRQGGRRSKARRQGRRGSSDSACADDAVDGFSDSDALEGEGAQGDFSDTDDEGGDGDGNARGDAEREGDKFGGRKKSSAGGGGAAGGGAYRPPKMVAAYAPETRAEKRARRQREAEAAASAAAGAAGGRFAAGVEALRAELAEAPAERGGGVAAQLAALDARAGRIVAARERSDSEDDFRRGGGRPSRRERKAEKYLRQKHRDLLTGRIERDDLEDLAESIFAGGREKDVFDVGRERRERGGFEAGGGDAQVKARPLRTKRQQAELEERRGGGRIGAADGAADGAASRAAGKAAGKAAGSAAATFVAAQHRERAARKEQRREQYEAARVRTTLPRAEAVRAPQEKRATDYKIEKNRGLTRKRKKTDGSSRVHNRDKYATKVKKFRSIVGAAAGDGAAGDDYAGERTGIKHDLRRSVPLTV